MIRLSKTLILLTVLFTQQLAFAECVREINNPSAVELDGRQEFRIRLDKELILPRYSKDFSEIEGQVLLQGGQLVAATREIHNGRAYVTRPYHRDQQLPFCYLNFRMGQLSRNEAWQISEKCMDMSKEGKFCDELDQYAGKLEAGHTFDLGTSYTSSRIICNNGRSIVPQAEFQDNFKLQLWRYQDRDQSRWPQNLDAQPGFISDAYGLVCGIPEDHTCASTTTAQTILGAFPAGSITIFSVDKNIENCEVQQ